MFSPFGFMLVICFSGMIALFCILFKVSTRRSAPISFNVSNYVSITPEKLDYLISRGFEIGNHTNTHVNLGKASKDEIQKASNALMNKYKELKIEVYPIENNFFGKSITVAGLVTGRDIINSLKGKNIPKTADKI